MTLYLWAGSWRLPKSAIFYILVTYTGGKLNKKIIKKIIHNTIHRPTIISIVFIKSHIAPHTPPPKKKKNPLQ